MISDTTPIRESLRSLGKPVLITSGKETKKGNRTTTGMRDDADAAAASLPAQDTSCGQ